MIPAQAMYRRAGTASVAAPVGGWNVRDALAEMQPNQAVIFQNWWPTTVDVQIRRGCANWCTGLNGTVETLMAYNKTDGTRQIFAVTSSGNLYNVTSAGAVGAALVTGLANGRWQYIAFATPGGNFLLACNGSDNMLRYNGTQWVSVCNGTGAAISSLTGNGTTSTVTTATPHGLQTGNTITVTGASVGGFNVAGVAITKTGVNTFTYLSAGTPSATGASYTVAEAITGIDPKQVSNLNAFKARVWLVQKNSLSAWYLPALAIQGAAVEFPMGSVFSMGGYVNAMATWSVDAGQGSDDLVVFLSSEGEILQYKGTDPSSASTFALVGLFRQGNPIGNRCQTKFGGDVYVITSSGVVPLSRSVLTAQVTESAAITDKIMPAMASAVTANSSFGWEMAAYPSVNMLLINVPSAAGNTQFAMNTITGAFTTFSGWNASCWCVAGPLLLYGMAGKVVQAWVTDTDFGAPIVAQALPAFSSFGSDTQTKKINLVRPILSSAGTPSFLLGLNYDYDTTTQPTGVLNFSAPSTGMIWGSMVWGSMTWGGALATNRYWQFAAGIGYSASMYIIAQGNGAETRWAATDYVFERGGVL